MKQLTFVVVFVALHVGFAEADVGAQDRPNVLLLLTDDQRADTIHALGNDAIQTPHLDRVARRGFVFDRAYCFGADYAAVCVSSRNMLLSGRTYFAFPGTQLAPADGSTFPAVMKAAGYETWHEGKRGNTATEIHTQFDHSAYLKDRAVRTSGEHGKQLVDDAIAFLDNRQGDTPFFMYLAFAGPHDPRVAADHYLQHYDPAEIPLPANYRPLHPFDNGEMEIRDERLAPWPRTEEVVRRHLHDYYACITSIDGHIGRLLAAMEQAGLMENTILVFSSDHGLAVGSHGLFGKQNLYEDGMRVPLIVVGPGIPTGRSDALVYLQDIFPSVCELVGAPVPAGLDFQSFAPVIRGQAARVRDSLLLAYRQVQRSMRDDRWKLIRYPQINKSQLFDLQSDPHELHDLAGDPAYADQLAKMTRLMQQTQQQVGDDQALVVDRPQSAAWTPPTDQ